VGLALATMLTTIANASLTYTWVPDTSINSVTTSGTLTIDAGVVSSFSFTLGDITFNGFDGSTLVLTDLNLQLNGTSSSTSTETGANWIPNAPSGPD